jgi:endonuclease III
MAKPSRKELARAVVARFGRTFAEELGIRIERAGPAALFQLLVFALLASARIRHRAAADAAHALHEKGWTTPHRLAASTWRQRTDTLNRAGYARYDESTSRMLGRTAALLLEEYAGDLRRLREAAGRDPERERELLKRFQGIGDTGADIFLREIQGVWEEVFPLADRRALEAAKRLGLGDEPRALAGLVRRRDFPRLVAGLVRCALEDGFDEVREAAA